MPHPAVDAVLPAGNRLAGRKIIVTGAASGMGKAIAELFAAEGAKLALFDVQPEKLREVEAVTGGKAIDVNVASEQSIKDGVAAAEAFLSGVDGIVNAAGILRTLPLAETSPALWRRVQDVNLFGPFCLCNTALPALRKSGQATIVNIASMGGIDTPPLMACYGASKAGLIALTKGQATEWAPDIRANAIAPGVIRTPMTDELWRGTNRSDDEVVALRVGLRRKGEPMEVAYMALYLTSRESSFVTGSVFQIHGGPAMPAEL
jgi:NAD(P)-dependent dehydrogenase (short-subunit alcohol dehydrogenase family)